MNRFLKVKREFKRTRHKFIIFTALTSLGFVIFKVRSAPESPSVYCHNDTNYSLPMLKENDTLPTRSIFFIEPYCANNLTARESCAIESAAKSNPNWQINIISSAISNDTVEELKQFNKMKNIKFWRVHITDLSIGTPLEDFVSSENLKKCRDRERSLNVLKYLLLNKWGGIYIDLGMIVMRPMGSLVRNWVTRENDEAIAERIFGISKDAAGKLVAESAIRSIKLKLKHSDWCNNPRIMTEVFENLCSTRDVNIMSSATCNGFEVYGSQFFYPIPKQHARELFKPGELANQNAYTYYLWRHDTKDYIVRKGSPYYKLAKTYCPKTYKLYSNHFGL